MCRISQKVARARLFFFNSGHLSFSCQVLKLDEIGFLHLSCQCNKIVQKTKQAFQEDCSMSINKVVQKITGPVGEFGLQT